MTIFYIETSSEKEFERSVRHQEVNIIQEREINMINKMANDKSISVGLGKYLRRISIIKQPVKVGLLNAKYENFGKNCRRKGSLELSEGILERLVEKFSLIWTDVAKKTYHDFKIKLQSY